MITKDGERNPNSGKSKAEQASNKGQKKKNTGTGNKGGAQKTIPSASTSTPKTTPSSSTSGSLTTPKPAESSTSNSSSSSSSSSSKKKSLSAAEKSKALSDLMDRATIGSSRTYGLSFQSSANRKISDAESKRKQTLVEQATKNGYLGKEKSGGYGSSGSFARESGGTGTSGSFTRESGGTGSSGSFERKSDGTGSYGSFDGKAKSATPSVLERVGNAMLGGAIQSGGTSLDAVGTMYQAGQGGRDTLYGENLEWYQHQLETEEATLKSMQAENRAKPGTYNLKAIQNQQRIIAEAQKKVNAFSPVKQAQEKSGEAARNLAADVSNIGAKRTEQAKEGASALGQMALDALSSTAQMGVDAAANAALGTPGSMLPFAFRAFGGGTQEARSEGATLEQQMAFGSAMAAKEIFTEKMFNIAGLQNKAYGKGSVDDYVEKAISGAVDKLAKTETGQRLIGGGLTLLGGAAGEGLEELIGDWMEWQLPRIYKKDPKSAKEVAQDSIYDFLVGALSGTFGSLASPGNILNYQQPGSQTQGQRIVDPTASPLDQAILDTLQGVQTPENVTQAREATALDNAILAAMNQNKNTSADVAEVESTSVNDNPATHTPQEMQVIEAYKTSVNDNLRGFIERVRGLKDNGFRSKIRTEIETQTDNAAKAAAALTGVDTAGYTNIIKGNAVQHIDNRHGANGTADHSMQNIEDFSRIGFVLDNFTDAEIVPSKSIDSETAKLSREWRNSDNTHAPLVRYSMPVNGTYYVVEAVPASNAHVMAVVSAYMAEGHGKSTLNQESTLPVNRASDGTSETLLDSMLGASNQNVAQAADSVNRENVGAGASTGAAPAGFDPLSHASNQYGAIEPGENPTRVVDFPVSMDGETKVGQFSRTMAEAGVTTQQAYEAIENLVAQNRMSHEIATDDAALEHASATISTQMIDGMSIESVRSQFIREASEGKATKDLAARGFLLYEQAVREGNGSAVIDLAVAMNDVATNAGQALQAQRMLKKLTPEWRLQAIQRSVSTINENLRNKAGSKYNQDAENIRLDDALVTEYLQADSDAARDEVVGKMQKQIASQIPSTLGERWNDMRYLNMLGNFKTQVRNITGNVGAQGLREIKNKVAWAGEGLTYLLSGKKFDRTKAFFVNESLMDAAYKTFDQYADVAMGDAKFRDTGNTGNDFLKGVEEARQGQVWTNADGKVMNTKVGKVAGKVLQGYHNVTDFAMNEFGDKPFSKFAFARSLAGWLKVHNITAEQWNSDTWLAEGNNRELADRGIQYAIKEAQESTFRETNAVSKWVAGIGRGKNTPWAVRVAAEGTIPFRKTPANVLAQMERFSPLGVINTIAEGVKVKNGEATGADVINAAAEALTGTGLMWLGFGLAKAGILRGKKDDPQDELEGHQSYALELADKMLSYTIDWFASTSVPLLIGAQIYELSGKDNIEVKDFGDALLSIADPLIETSMLSSVNDTLSQLRYSDANMGQILVTMAANYVMQGLTSTLMGQIERTFEKTRQQTYLDPDSSTPIWMQSLLGKMSQKVPGWDYQQADYIDQWGRTEDNGSLGKRAFNNFLNPGYSSKINVTDVDTEIRRLEQQTGEDYTPSTVPKYVNVKNADGEAEKVYLDAEQYNAYRTTKGQTDFALRQAFLENETYQGLPANVQGKIQRYCEKYADELGKKAAVNDYQISDGFKDYNDMTQEEVMEDLILRAVGEEKYISDEAKNKLGNVQKLYDSLAYAGVSDDLKESAREKAAAYFQDAEKAKFGYELSEEQQKLEGKNQKTLAEYFLDEAVKAKYKDSNKDGTNRDELLQAYNDNELNDRTAIAVLSAREVDAYQKFGKAAGVTPQMMLEASSAHARMHEVKDNDGIVTSSVQNQYDDWLDSRNLTEEQKKALRMGFYGDTVDTYNKLVEDLDLGNITVGEAKQELSPTYQYGWTHNVSSTGVQMRDYISSMATFENAPTAEERDKMGFDSKWEWFCNELNKNTELTKEQKYAIAISTNRSMAESTKKKIANKLGTAYVAPTMQADGSGASSTAVSSSGGTAVTSTESATSGSGSYASSGTGGGTFSGWSSDTEEKSQAQKAYERFGMAAGATEAMYQEAKAALKNIETVYDMDGNVVRSAEDQFDSWLERQDWTEDQKDAVRAGFYADSVKNLRYLSSELREGNISVAAAKSELSARAQTGWTRSVMDTGAAMADYIDAWAQFKEAPNADERKSQGFGTKWAWFCDYLNQTDMTAEQKYAIAVSVQDYAESTRKKIQKNVGWDGVSSAEQEPQEETYDIRTDDGYREYLSLLLKRKDRYEAKDGSVWSVGENGDVIVRTKDGRQLRARAVLGRNGFDDEPGEGYTVGSKAGQLAYKMMQNGVMKTWDAPDGWTWKLVRGEIIAEKNGTKIPVRMAG